MNINFKPKPLGLLACVVSRLYGGAYGGSDLSIVGVCALEDEKEATDVIGLERGEGSVE